MDVFNFMQSRQTNIEEIFQQQPSPNVDLDRSFKQLQFNMEKQIRAWWDIASFEMYILKNQTPRRLRWDVYPNDGLEDLTLADEWFQFSNACEQKLLQLMIRRRKAKNVITEAHITDLKTSMGPFMGSKEYLERAQTLQSHLTKYDGNIKNKKLKKYHRDTKDYQDSKVYKWQIKSEPIGSKDSSIDRDIEVHNLVTLAANKFKTQSSTPKKTKKTSQGPQQQGGRGPPPQPPYNSGYHPGPPNNYQPAPYMAPNHNRFAPLDNRPMDYNYSNYYQGPQQYAQRPPRGKSRGNHRGKQGQQHPGQQPGGEWRGWNEPYKIPTNSSQPPKINAEPEAKEGEPGRKRARDN